MRSKRLMIEAVIAATVCGCSAPAQQRSPAEQSRHTPVATQELPVLVSDLALRPLEGVVAQRWEPGTSLRVGVVVTNTGKALTDYPSVVLESGDARVKVADEQHILYGLVSRHRVPLGWTITSSNEVPVGTAIKLSVRVFAHNSDWKAGRAPVGRSEFTIAAGQLLSK